MYHKKFQGLERSTKILTNEIMNIGNNIGHHGADGPSSALIVFNGPEPSTPLKYMCTAYTLFPKHLSSLCWELHSTFPAICTESEEHMLFHSYIHHEISTYHRMGIIKKYCKISTHLYEMSLQNATMITVQMVAPVFTNSESTS